jgi:predicted component of type VI protein secretion system
VLARTTFTADEVAAARGAVASQVAALRSVPEDAEPELAAAALLALDRRFVHRVRLAMGTATTPLTELELIADSLINSGGRFRAGTVVKWVPGDSVLEYGEGDRIRLTADDLEQLAAEVFTELETRFG